MAAKLRKNIQTLAISCLFVLSSVSGCIGEDETEKLTIKIAFSIKDDYASFDENPQKLADYLSKETGINSPKLLHWARRAELMQIKNLGKDYSDLLEAVGVESIADLKRRNPESLHEAMMKINSKKKVVDRMPSLKKVTNWISESSSMEIKVSS